MCFSEKLYAGYIIPSNKTLNVTIYKKYYTVAFFHRRVYGNMMGDAEDDSGSLDSDSDLILDGDGGAAGAGGREGKARLTVSKVYIFLKATTNTIKKK